SRPEIFLLLKSRKIFNSE
ncbi:unnamed protein product, partial [Rotaria magnacalcarata]